MHRFGQVRWSVELDENFKQLVKELGYAINESLSDSDRIAQVMAKIRAAGYDPFLVLEVTLGFNKRDEAGLPRRHKLTTGRLRNNELHFTSEDAQFLRALKISLEE